MTDDDAVFQTAMVDVRPVDWNTAPPPRPRRLEISGVRDEDAVLRMLQEFCRSGLVGPEHTREYAEHWADPVGRGYVPDLRLGRFSVEAHLDLHGVTVSAARRALDVFIRDSVRAGYACVRVIHGRGLHSPRQRPRVKDHVERWLRHRRMSRLVAAYTTARPVDGGGGAVYVLLRK